MLADSTLIQNKLIKFSTGPKFAVRWKCAEIHLTPDVIMLILPMRICHCRFHFASETPPCHLSLDYRAEIIIDILYNGQTIPGGT